MKQIDDLRKVILALTELCESAFDEIDRLRNDNNNLKTNVKKLSDANQRLLELLQNEKDERQKSLDDIKKLVEDTLSEARSKNTYITTFTQKINANGNETNDKLSEIDKEVSDIKSAVSNNSDNLSEVRSLSKTASDDIKRLNESMQNALNTENIKFILKPLEKLDEIIELLKPQQTVDNPESDSPANKTSPIESVQAVPDSEEENSSNKGET